ncbi:hypothetical protein VP01_3483g1, partial [Puccinia sorghi]
INFMALIGQREMNLTTLGIKTVENVQVGFWKMMKEYLETWRRPEHCDDKNFARIKRRSATYFVEEGQLKKRKLPYSQT